MDCLLDKLSCRLNRKDEQPNVELARRLFESGDTDGIREIVEGLKSPEREVANDCIKVLYEIGSAKPELISGYAKEFINLLRSSNNRLVWGGMTALAKIVGHSHETIFENLPEIISAYENGSVITVDNCVSVFAGLCGAGERYAEKVLPVLLKHLANCKPKELAQHAERASVCFSETNAKQFFEIFERRLEYLTPPQRTRMNKVLSRLRKYL